MLVVALVNVTDAPLFADEPMLPEPVMPPVVDVRLIAAPVVVVVSIAVLFTALLPVTLITELAPVALISPVTLAMAVPLAFMVVTPLSSTVVCVPAEVPTILILPEALMPTPAVDAKLIGVPLVVLVVAVPAVMAPVTASTVPLVASIDTFLAVIVAPVCVIELPGVCIVTLPEAFTAPATFTPYPDPPAGF